MDILAVLVPLEKAINAFINTDETAKLKLNKLQGKTFLVKLKGLSTQFYLVFSTDKIYFQQTLLRSPTVVVEAYPFALLRLLLSDKIHPGILSEQVYMEGDMNFAQECKEFFRSLKVDWQYYLAPIIGDSLTQSADTILTKAVRGFKGLVQNFRKNTVNYLQNEVNYLPHPYAMEHYLQEVNELRSGVDRLTARVELLKKKIES